MLGASQAGYGAANVFLDALAQRRASEGRPALSMAWGAWALDRGMSSWLSEVDLLRLKRQGLPAFTADTALEAFDAALAARGPVVVPMRVDQAALRVRADDIPALLRGLAKIPGRTQTQPATGRTGPTELVKRLSGRPADEQLRELLDTVRTHAAVVLGHASAAAIEADRGFLDLGFDSLSALEMRNRMVALVGKRLTPMLLFDYPSPTALAAFLHEEFFETAPRGIDEDLVGASAARLFDILDQELETPG